MPSRSAWQRERGTWPHSASSRFVAADGFAWHVQIMGRGPALLLIHGTGASTHSWRKLMPLLAQDYRVVALDLPGHGFTEPAPAGRSSIGGMSRGVAALLGALEVEPRHCVGHSAGAVILCRMALDHRFAPRSIISINGAFVPLQGAAGVLFTSMARLMARAPLLPRLLASSAGRPDNVARLLAGTGSRLDADDVALYARLARSPEHVAGALRMMGQWDLRGFSNELSRLETPLDLLVADDDRTVPPRQALAIAAHVTRASIHRLASGGHLVHEEQPGRMAREIDRLCRVR